METVWKEVDLNLELFVCITNHFSSRKIYPTYIWDFLHQEPEPEPEPEPRTRSRLRFRFLSYRLKMIQLKRFLFQFWLCNTASENYWLCKIFRIVPVKLEEVSEVDDPLQIDFPDMEVF